jgi:hypothetical protein
MDNYNPELVCMGRKAKQQVELTLQTWGYSSVVFTQVGGNCLGLSVIETAIGIVYDRLVKLSEETGNPVRIVLTAPDGTELICEDDDESGEDWIKDMVVGARILSIEDDGFLIERKKKRAAQA